MPRGGKREGRVGGMYPARSDLRKPKLRSVDPTPTGLPYGAHQAMTEQRAAMPLPSPTAVPDQPPAVPQAPVVPLNAPTQRPDEPLTAGLDVGPGPGSEILGLPASTPQNVSDLLASLAESEPTGVIADLLATARQLGL